MTENSLDVAIEQVIKFSGKTYEETGELIKSEIFLTLYMVYGQTLLSALDLIDDKKVSIITSPSGRRVYKVIGGSGAYYTLIPNSSFCQCLAYKYSILKQKDTFVCKHVLAAKLANAMKLIKKEEISDDAMIDVMFNI